MTREREGCKWNGALREERAITWPLERRRRISLEERDFADPREDGYETTQPKANRSSSPGSPLNSAFLLCSLSRTHDAVVRLQERGVNCEVGRGAREGLHVHPPDGGVKAEGVEGAGLRRSRREGWERAVERMRGFGMIAGEVGGTGESSDGLVLLRKGRYSWRSALESKAAD